MQRFAGGVVALLLALAPAAQACQIVSKEYEAQRQTESRMQVLAMAPQLARRADAIFIATVQSTRDVGDLSTEAVLKVDESLKGDAPPRVLATSSIEGQTFFSCNPADYFDTSGFANGDRLLVYVEESRAIRTRQLDANDADDLLPLAEERAIIEADAQFVDPALPAFRYAERYARTRATLIAAGWAPVPATCGNGKVCFRGQPELATNLSTGRNEAEFERDGRRIRLLLRSIADDSLVLHLAWVDQPASSSIQRP